MGPGEVTSAKILDGLFRDLQSDASILDVGCIGFHQYKRSQLLGFKSHHHYGVDYASPSGDLPPAFVFKHADLNKDPMPFEDDFFDLIIASHIIEHLANPIEFFAECARVCKPGGVIYFEAPSERSLMIPGMPFRFERFYSTSYFDDPTHMFRPWTPQAFYRLTKYFGCEPLRTGYYTSTKVRLLFPLLLSYALITRNPGRLENWVWRAFGWACYLVVQKPKEMRGKPVFEYFYPEGRT
ncbi:MAG TPA: class I SAM-dependent methyltransferase [Bacteroidota bacterium]|nr:class I SAM-dependent methyltransferase [Bacteroidota bacterium]